MSRVDRGLCPFVSAAGPIHDDTLGASPRLIVFTLIFRRHLALQVFCVV